MVNVTVSCEFFPPKTDEGNLKLKATREKLIAIDPSFFSVTFGAGGSTRDNTIATVMDIHAEARLDVAPHLSCMGASKEAIRDLLNMYKEKGIKRLVALRGDLPSGTLDAGAFRYANELVEFIRAETGDHFFIEVAAYPEFHPQADTAELDLLNFKRKVEAGANSAITQYFYNADAYFRFVESCQRMGLDIPIVPGIMPITNFTKLARFSDSCGAEIPRWLRGRLQSFGDDIDSIRAFGVDVITGLCQNLLAQGAPGLHFYTMNQVDPTMTIWKNLKL